VFPELFTVVAKAVGKKEFRLKKMAGRPGLAHG
jgi:hypothetical protein